MGTIYYKEMFKRKLQKIIKDTRESTIKEITEKQSKEKRLKEFAKSVMDASKKILEEKVLPNDEFIKLLELMKKLDDALSNDDLELFKLRANELNSLNDRLNKLYQYVKKNINGTDCFGIYEAYKLLIESPVILNKLKEKGLFFEILHIFASSKKGHAVSCIYKLIRDGEILEHPSCIELLNRIKLINFMVSSECITSLIKRHSFGKRDVKITEIIVSYRSLSKLASARKKMFGRQSGLLEDCGKSEISLKTFEHFKDYPDDGTGLFGCTDLFEEETDPTVERQIGQLYDKVLSLPYSKQILALKKAEQAIRNV